MEEQKKNTCLSEKLSENSSAGFPCLVWVPCLCFSLCNYLATYSCSSQLHIGYSATCFFSFLAMCVCAPTWASMFIYVKIECQRQQDWFQPYMMVLPSIFPSYVHLYVTLIASELRSEL